MATVIVAPGTIGGAAIKRVSYLTGMNEFEAFGRLARLWAESQELCREDATEEEIGFWLGAGSPEEAKEWVDAFSDPLAGFLSLENDRYLINGNPKHIAKANKAKRLAQANAEKRWQKEIDRAATMPSGQQAKPQNDANSHATSNADSNPTSNATSIRSRMPELNQAELNQAEPSTKEKKERIGAPAPKISTDTIQACCQTWKDTLAAIGIQRGLSLGEEQEIGRACANAKWGTEYVDHALYGYRFREKSEKFDPKKHVSLRHIFGKDEHGHDRIDSYVNLGAPKRAAVKSERLAAELKRTEDAENQEIRTDPEKVRALLGRFANKSPRKSNDETEQDLEKRRQQLREQVHRLNNPQRGAS